MEQWYLLIASDDTGTPGELDCKNVETLADNGELAAQGRDDCSIV